MPRWQSLTKFPKTLHYTIVERGESTSCCYVRQDLLNFNKPDGKLNWEANSWSEGEEVSRERGTGSISWEW